MAFVKLDTGILDSSLWLDRISREVFITSLLMAVPYELTAPANQLKVRSLEPTGFVIPVGWYGFIKAAGIGIANRALVDIELGLKSLEKMGSPEPESRSQDHEGRRLARVDGGYIVLNYFKYRDRDNSAERQRKLRERRRLSPVTSRDITRDNPVTSRIAEAEAEEKKKDMSSSSTEMIFDHWKVTFNHPKAVLDAKRKKVISNALKLFPVETICTALTGYKTSKWHMGENDRKTVFDAIDLLLRDARHIEAGFELVTNPTKKHEWF